MTEFYDFLSNMLIAKRTIATPAIGISIPETNPIVIKKNTRNPLDVLRNQNPKSDK
jgi:hypothetical protein